jgi:hypothetical protein
VALHWKETNLEIQELPSLSSVSDPEAMARHVRPFEDFSECLKTEELVTETLSNNIKDAFDMLKEITM